MLFKIHKFSRNVASREALFIEYHDHLFEHTQLDNSGEFYSQKASYVNLDNNRISPTQFMNFFHI